MSALPSRLSVLLVGGLLLAGCHQHEAADPRTEAPLVRTATATRDASTHPSFTGVVAARVESDLGFRVAGKITARLVDVGQQVKKGDILMRLDPNDLTLGIAAGQGAVAAARAHSVQADADLARLDGLVKLGAISAQDLDRARANAQAAKAQLDAAVAEVSIAKNAGDYAELRSDVDGIVVRRLGDEGQVVSAGQTVVSVAKSGPREASIDLPENVRPVLGSSAVATLYGESGSSLATLRELSLSADPMTRTYAARYVLSGDAAKAPLGATVTVELTNADDATQAEVPVGAIYDRGAGPGVWLVDTGKSTISYRPVKVKQLGEETAVLSGGIALGDMVVAMGGPELHDGQTVRLATSQATP